MILLFVYGTLMRGEPNHGRLAGARFLGEAVTCPVFTMISLGGFPAILEGGTTAIVGELYDVTPRILQGCDRLEGHPSFYERLDIALATREGVPLPAIPSPVGAYVLPRYRAHASRPIPSGSWRQHRAERASTLPCPEDE